MISTSLFHNGNGHRGSVTLSFVKDPALVAAVRLTVAAVAARADLSFETIEDLKLVAAEAATYSMQRGTRTGKISMTLECDERMFLITLHDPDFKPPHAGRFGSWPAGDVADELYLIRTLADELQYHIGDADGLRLRISKKI